ncbi:MAG: hypothetical protein LBJ04_10700 [Sphingobacterium sp.]|jgi:hypothetical protein|uniref:hypothetical protein n=1 Tax=Sphingobacterium sp. TaxID=341027 RepID=UPI00281C08F6|nr:hypothetical protein [Sphingobacterium sp.]MDR0263682.1 hypothetical protein [Sphingobacterium sp.]
MKLVELIDFFRNGGSFEEFCRLELLNEESEVIGIFMEMPLDIDNELRFFEIEKTGGRLEYTDHGINYYNLFDFYYFLDTVEEAGNDQNEAISNEELTKLLYNYAINDA